MATTPAEFFSKNMKWIALVLLFLLIFSRIQSCNRNMRYNIISKQLIQQFDSIEIIYDGYYKKSQDSIKKLNFELKLAKEKENEADKRANAVQSVAEKIRANTTTTVNVRGAEVDTIKRKEK